MAIDPKSIRRAMMVAKDIAASVSNVPLMRADGGEVDGHPDQGYAPKPAGVLKVDNPGGDWLKENREYSENKGYLPSGAPKSFGKVTAVWRHPKTNETAPVYLPVSMLSKIPGVMSEQENVRSNDLDWLVKSMRETGKLPKFKDDEYKPFITVDHHGRPFVSEGNHRIMAAAKLGWNYLPVEVRYFNGAEDVDGPLHPDRIRAMQPQEKAKGGSIDQDLKIANLIGADTSSIPEIRKAGELNKFRQSMQEDVQSRAQQMANLGQRYHESGLLPHPVGTLLQNPSYRQNNLPPMKVMGHYVDPKKPDRYGYFVKQGDTDTIAFVSDPDADQRMKKINPAWDREKYWNQMQPLRGPQGFAKAEGGVVDNQKSIRRALMVAKAGGGELVQSPALAQTFALENRPAAIVSPRPGKGGGPPIIPEAGAHYDPSLEQDREPWSFSTPDIIGAAKPPPIQHPVFNQPRMRNLANATAKIFKTKGFNDVVEGMTGLRNLTVMPTVGTWKNELEPSFIIQHPDMTPEHAEKIAHLLGFGFQQDAAVHTTHNPDISAGIPAALIGNGKKLSQEKIDQLNGLAGKHGLDFTVTGDGKAAKFLHFGDEVDYSNFLDKINDISESANLPEKYHARTTGDLINAKGYINGIFGASGKGEGIPAGAERSPDLFRGIVDHVLAPYAKAVAGEGYRLSPERLKEAYGLTDEETDHVRNALYPTRKGDRTTIPLMTGEETLDVQPTGSKGKATVGDVLYSLQNRAAAQGQIEPGDYSPKAMDTIARHIADEVNYHVQNSPKSAVGWYDKALKAAMQQYSQIFPEIASDPNKELLFHSILGITSQGNDVFSNSTHAARIYNLVRNGASLPDAVKQLRGSFGDKTRQIEQNLLKLHHLVDNNGYDKMRDVFNRKMTVSEWNKLLNKDETLYGPDGKPLKVDGGKDQKVTGWSVFGPKIGSFINNLHGDYSTLTADLWFSRTWNRLLGYNFVHTPLAEAKQYRDFRDALKAEYYNSNPNIGVSPSYKTENGKIIRDSKGNPTQWDYGNDAPQLSKEDFDRVSNDPDEMLKLAQGLEEKYRKSQYREKSDLRRRAKNWVENRELPEALPRSDLERNFQQNTVEKAQKLLKQKYGMDISIADIQAALWFHEKELFGKLGVASEKAAPADYADAASKTVDAFKNNDLYTVKSRAPKVAKSEIPMPRESGGAVERALQVARQAAGINAMMPRYGRR